MRLGVNIDHVATLREARKENEPVLVDAALEALNGGADGITIHLREDRRHIQDRDVPDIRKISPYLNLEIACTDEMIGIATQHKPDAVCFVPEKREELTTEGGLNVIRNTDTLRSAIATLNAQSIRVSLFVDPNPDQISAAAELGASIIEIHTGNYANARSEDSLNSELNLIKESVKHGNNLGLEVHAGHGLRYSNVEPIKNIPGIVEFNIGHSIISRSIFCGIRDAVREMKVCIQ